jgi:hypothetical protein
LCHDRSVNNLAIRRTAERAFSRFQLSPAIARNVRDQINIASIVAIVATFDIQPNATDVLRWLGPPALRAESEAKEKR